MHVLQLTTYRQRGRLASVVLGPCYSLLRACTRAKAVTRRSAIMIPAALGVPTAFIYLLAQDYVLVVVGFALQGMFACSGVHVQYPAYLSERFPTEVRATAVAFCFHQGAIWGGLISPALGLVRDHPSGHAVGTDPRHHGRGSGGFPRGRPFEPRRRRARFS